MVGGLLLVVEAAVTVAWKEPVSSLIATRAQAGLDDDLDQLVREAHANESPPPTGRDRSQVRRKRDVAARAALRQQQRAKTGKPIGRIRIPTLDVSFVLVEGTGTGPLRKGPGHYEDTPFPGLDGTFGVAGHRTTYGAPFGDIDRLDRGDMIEVLMPYAKFSYRVKKTEIVEPDEVWVKKSRGRERLVLTACHPRFSAAQRIVVFADLHKLQIRS